MEAQSQKGGGMNLNPLAPAQSKHTFAFPGKTRTSIGHSPMCAVFFLILLCHFRAFSRNVEINVQGLAPEPYKYTKMGQESAN